MVNKRIAGVVALVGVALVVTSASRSDPGQQPIPEGMAPFRGKIVVVAVEPPASGEFLEDARIRVVGGHAFLVGKVPHGPGIDEGDPRVGNTTWIPLSKVLKIVEQTDLERALKANDLNLKREG